MPPRHVDCLVETGSGLESRSPPPIACQIGMNVGAFEVGPCFSPASGLLAGNAERVTKPCTPSARRRRPSDRIGTPAVGRSCCFLAVADNGGVGGGG